MPFTGHPHINNFSTEDTVFLLCAFTLFCIAVESAPSYVLHLLRFGFKNTSAQGTTEALPHQQRAKYWFMVLYVMSASYILMQFNMILHWLFPWAGSWMQWGFFIIIWLALIAIRRIVAHLFFIAIHQSTTLLQEVYNRQKSIFIALAIGQSLLIVYFNIQAQSIQFLIYALVVLAILMVLLHAYRIIKSLWASNALSFFQFFSYLCIVEVFPLAIGIKLLLVFI
jgi:hypothetical protein